MSKTEDRELQVILTTVNIELKPADTATIEEKAHRLSRFYQRLIDCRVKVKGPGQHHQKGGPYQVSLTLGVPGPDLYVTQKTGETLEEAIRDAFKAAERQLEDYSQKVRGA